jgi:hypothetical protein
MSDNRALARTAASQYGLLTIQQQRAGGLSHQTVRNRRARGRYERVGRGVDAVAGTPDTWHRAMLAALLSAGDDATASHRAALRMWGIGYDREVELAVRYDRAPIVPGAVVHRSLDLVENDIVTLDGIPVTSVARSLVDAGAVLDVEALEVVVERALGRGLTTPEELRTTLERVAKRGRRGAGRLRAVLDRRGLDDQLTESELEEIFGKVCHAIGVPPPRTQVPVTLCGNDYRLDFAWPDRMVAAEVNGFTDHSRRRRWERDHERRNDLMAAGWTVPEFTKRQLRRDRAHVRRTLEAVL